MEILGPEEVCAKWNIKEVSQVVDILGLMGDAVDNIPGIAGVGEKTAAKLLAQYGTLENVLADADNIKGALGEKVRKGREDAILSKKLATIITNVPVEFHEEDFRIKEWNKEKLKEVFSALEFKTIGKRLLGDDFAPAAVVAPVGVQTDLFGNIIEPEPAKTTISKTTSAVSSEETESVFAGKNIQNTPHQYEAVVGDIALNSLVTVLKSSKEICLDTETTGIDANTAELVGLSFSIKPAVAYYVPCPANREETLAILAYFSPLFNDASITWVGQNLKYDMLVLKWYGVELAGNLFDTMLAHYVIEPDGKRSMDALAEKYLGYVPVAIEELIGKKGKSQGTMRDVELDKIKDYAAEDADIALQLKHVFAPMLAELEVEKVFNEVENPLVKVLMEMEYEGIRVDEAFLHEYSKELELEAKKRKRVFINKPVYASILHLQNNWEKFLFDKLKLDPSAKKTKTGQYQTGEDVLLKLAARGIGIVDDILTFRELTKLKSTYVDALPVLINPKTNRVHTTYGQAVAVTGRLASNNPNLQNIPVRTDRGREIRKAFIPRDKDHILISADYSQIELRIVAAISGDQNMCDAFKRGTDIHTATAARVYNVEESEVTKEMRYKAKSVNFGIIYGQGAFGLADNLGITRTEAKEIIDNYKKQFPGIQEYMDTTINFAREHGYVQTLMGRKRWLRDINSANFTVRGFAERNAINSPIQGTAADMIKLAMQKVFAAMRREKMKSRMILQVHDELVFDALRSEVNELRPLILENMQTAMPLPNDVPVIAECGEGENWLQAH
ncbi:MAG: DNA polymerase I [Chitinophagaceae bacterium]|nr:DNA polymerase I [Chitinophagaceae bacterium]